MSSRFSRGVDFDVGGLRQMGRWRWISLVQNPDLSVDLIAETRHSRLQLSMYPIYSRSLTAPCQPSNPLPPL
jgi:hypothetical protein